MNDIDTMNSVCYQLISKICGGLAEWSKAHAWKACKGQPFESSNLLSSAI